jgi:hypothetical protein
MSVNELHAPSTAVRRCLRSARPQACHVPYRFDGKQLFVKYVNESVEGIVSTSFGFRQPSCRVYGDTVGIVNRTTCLRE